MKVYFIGSKYMGCNYVRTLLPLWNNGWKGDVDSLFRGRKKPESIVNELLASDIVVFHRADTIDHHKTAQILRDNGVKIVFDNDDTFKNLEQDAIYRRITKTRYTEGMKKVNELMDRFISEADAVTTTTDFLAEEYKKLNKKVFVLPNCVDSLDWPEPKRNETDRVRVGIVGSVAYYNDAEVISNYLIELSGRKDVQLVLFGLQGKEDRANNKLVAEIYKRDYALWGKVSVEHVGAVPMAMYFKTLNDLKLDLMLIPRKDNYFNRCKSNVKFLEAAMLEIPVVAQSFSDKLSPYDFDINGENGLLATDTKSWKEQADKLIADKELRRKMGANAKEYVLANYNIKNHAYRWAEAYKTIL
jgi:glycosyltransferase involved in cell wall biosynthesis